MSTLTRLSYFNTVVETRSISEASRIFDVQPSSISRQLAVLEEELGVRLLNRTTRNIGLTEAGRKYLEYSLRIVAELDAAKRAVNDLQESPKGILKMSITIGFGESVILPLIPEFRKKYPHIDVDIELTERVVDMVEENIDIAIRSGRLPDSTMIAKRLTYNDFILCSSPQYLAEKGAPTSPYALKDFDCIRYSYRNWKDWYLMGDETEKLSIDTGLCVNSVNGQKQLLLNNAGLGLMPLWAIHDELSSNKLVHVLPEHTFSPYEVLSATYAIFLNRELMSPKSRVFLDFIGEHLSSK